MDTTPHLVAMLPCLLALILALMAKKAGPNTGWAALVGLLMVGLATWSFGLLGAVSSALGAPSSSDAAQSASLWLWVAPAAMASIGANLFSAWLSSEVPKKSE